MMGRLSGFPNAATRLKTTPLIHKPALVLEAYNAEYEYFPRLAGLRVDVGYHIAPTLMEIPQH